MRKETLEKLNTMNEEDVYSLVLFALFKLKDIPEYSSISELSYLLDSKNLLNLLEYYGGTTIRIPTIKEFKLVIQGLLLYQYTQVSNLKYEEAIKLIDLSCCSKKEVNECYNKLLEILSNYEFSRK